MRLSVVVAVVGSALLVAGCNPFYSVEQSTVERGYRWIGRGEYDRAISTFQTALRDYPDSGLATLGKADALAEAQRHRDAVAAYTDAISLLWKSGHFDSVGTPGQTQTIGERSFSYQNQGLRFPYGIEAYVYFRRALSYEALARTSMRHVEDIAAAKSDYASARKLAPAWKEPSMRLSCLERGLSSGCAR